jgi:hypothetical protein
LTDIIVSKLVPTAGGANSLEQIPGFFSELAAMGTIRDRCEHTPGLSHLAVDEILSR